MFNFFIGNTSNNSTPCSHPLVLVNYHISECESFFIIHTGEISLHFAPLASLWVLAKLIFLIINSNVFPFQRRNFILLSMYHHILFIHFSLSGHSPHNVSIYWLSLWRQWRYNYSIQLISYIQFFKKYSEVILLDHKKLYFFKFWRIFILFFISTFPAD